MYDSNGNYIGSVISHVTELIAVVAILIFLAYTAGRTHNESGEGQIHYEQNTNTDSRSIEVFKIEVNNND